MHNDENTKYMSKMDLIIKLALLSYYESGSELKVKVAPDERASIPAVEGCMFDGEHLIFNSQQDRLRIIKNFGFSLLKRHDAEWVHFAAKLEGSNAAEIASLLQDILSKAVGEKNVVDDVSSAIKSERVPRYKIFETLDVASRCFPLLETIDVDALFALTTAQHPFTKDDLARGRFLIPLEEKTKKDQELAKAIIEKFRQNPSEAHELLFNMAIRSLASKNLNAALGFLRECSTAKSPSLVAYSLWSLRNIVLKHNIVKSQLPVFVPTVRTNLDSENEEISTVAKKIVVSIAPYWDDFMNDLDRLISENDPESLSILAWELFSANDDVKNHREFWKWFRALSAIPPEFSGGISNFDHALADIIKSGKKNSALEILEEWITNWRKDITKKEFSELFSGSLRELSRTPDDKAFLITRWLARPGIEFAYATESLVSEWWVRGCREITLDRSQAFALDEERLKVLMCRSVGTLSYPEFILCFLPSLIPVVIKSPELVSFISTLIIHDVSIDYPKETLSALRRGRNRARSDRTRVVYDHIIDIIGNRIAERESMRSVREFEVNRHVSRAADLQRNKRMGEAQREASKGSIWRSLAKVVPLKAGKGSFEFRDGEYSAPTMLHSHEHVVRVPNRMVTDIVGLEMRQVMLRSYGSS